MKEGDKVIFRSNVPRVLWGVDTNCLLGNVYTIEAIIKLAFGKEAYKLKETGDYWFPAYAFVPYKELIVLIDRRRGYEI